MTGVIAGARRGLRVGLCIAVAACGARTRPLELAAAAPPDSSLDAKQANDAAPALDAGADAIDGRPAADCPPVTAGWTQSIVATRPSSYALAADPRCGVTIVVADSASTIEVVTFDARGAAVHAPLGLTGKVAAATLHGAELHVLYNDGRTLQHAVRRDGAIVATELVDPSGLGVGELIVDAAGVVHAVYMASTPSPSDVRYAARRSSWSVERVDSRPAFEPTLALGRDGTPIVAYQYVSSPSDHACVVGTRTAGGWSLTDLPRLDEHSSSNPCTVRATRDGDVEITFGAYRPEGFVLRHARGPIGALRFETIDRAGSFGVDVGAAAIDPAGVLRAAYRGVEPGSPLKLALARVGVGATIETIPDAAGAGGVLVVVDGADVTHVVYDRDGKLVHAARGTAAGAL